MTNGRPLSSVARASCARRRNRADVAATTSRAFTCRSVNAFGASDATVNTPSGFPCQGMGTASTEPTSRKYFA